MDVVDELQRRRRSQGAVMVLGAIAIAVFELLVILPAGYIHVKLVIVAGAFALVGMWRVLRAPWWVRRPDEVERIDTAGNAKQLQIIMRGGRLYEVVADREELELAIQQRANAIRLRARVVRTRNSDS